MPQSPNNLHVESEKKNLKQQIKNMLYNHINDRAPSGGI